MTQAKTTQNAPDAPPPAPIPTSGDLADMPIAPLRAAVAQAMTSIASIRAALPNATRLTTEERKHTGGKLKKGESAVLQTVADSANDPAFAPLVVSLADHDYGVDPKTFEVELLKERLQRVDALLPLADALSGLAQDMSDTVLELQELSAQPLRDAYAVFKSVSKTDATLRARIKDVIDFYSAIAQAALKTKRAKKAAAAAPAPGKA